MSSGGIGATTITNMVRPAGIDFDGWSGARASWHRLTSCDSGLPWRQQGGGCAAPHANLSSATGLESCNTGSCQPYAGRAALPADAPSEIERRPRNRHRRSSPRTTRGQNGGEARRIEACTGCKAAAMSEALYSAADGALHIDRLTGAGSFPALITLALAHVGQFSTRGARELWSPGRRSSHQINIHASQFCIDGIEVLLRPCSDKQLAHFRPLQ